MKFLSALRNVSSKLMSEFADSKLFEQNGDIGTFREEIISQLLRPFLPDCYGLGSGEIFSSDGKSNSNQIDIVIYDSVYSNVLFKNKKNYLFPCESVYGEIEIKTMLSTDELLIGMENIASMKRLNRQDSTMLDITPISHLGLGAGLQADLTKFNPYLGVILGFDGLTKETLIENLNNKLENSEKTEMPDFIFCFKRQYMALKMYKSQVASLGGNCDSYSVVNTGDDTIPMMFLTLNTCLNQIKLKTPNYNDYWKALFTELLISNNIQ